MTAGFTSEITFKKIQVDRCPTPPPAPTHVYAIIRHITIAKTKSDTEVKNPYRHKTEAVVRTTTEKERSREIHGLYTFVEKANAKVISLQQDETDDHKDKIKKVFEIEDGRVS
jgi:hypothetical protein